MQLARAFALTSFLAVCAPAQEITLDQILQKNTEALGGAEALKAVNTLQMEAKMVLQGGAMEAPMKLTVKRPNRVRTEIQVQGRPIIMAWDGSMGWMINPMMGSSDAQKLDETMTKQITQNADIEATLGSLAALKAGGHTLELQGREEVEGAPAYRIKVIRKSGDVQTYFISADTWLAVKTISKASQMGQELEVESVARDYKKVSGVTVAYATEQKVGGKVMMQMAVEKIDINSPVADEIFKMPAPAPKPENKQD